MPKFVLHRNTNAVRIVTDKKCGTLPAGVAWFFRNDRGGFSHLDAQNQRWFCPVGTLRVIAAQAVEPIQQYDVRGFLLS